ncbi:MAG TPA: GFA family protein [Caulobacteraceae bacterium]|nr:GFA family protein [Caulobacteraceae bacterium]
MPATERIASCACGALKVRCGGEPNKVSLCHCLACQRRTGSTHGVAAFFLREQLSVEGEARCYTRPSDRGFDVTFHFCPTCGSSVFWEPARLPDRVGVAVGAFADPTFPAPSQQVYEERRHPWLTLAIGGAE